MGGTLALHLAAHYEVDGVAVLAPGLYLRNKFAFLAHFLHPIIPYKLNFTGSDIKAQEPTKTYGKTPLRSVSQLLKFFKHLGNQIARYFDIKHNGFIYDGNKTARYYFVVKSKKEIIVSGPFIQDKKSIAAFKKRHKRTACCC